ncbi:response regulator [Puniceicoccaceae bacterium K14]|nr:response regulator [Puniceicoccaceae bacterium K14]
MSKIYILCVDDEPDVLEVIVRELEIFEDYFPVETASSADEARAVIRDIEKSGDHLGLILCDHVMIGENGVDLLISMQNSDFTLDTRKVLLTGQAGLEATVDAVNRASLSHYIAKPWSKDEVIKVVKEQMTHFFLRSGHDTLPYAMILDPMTLAKALHDGLGGDR